jgi:hypothetical protein
MKRIYRVFRILWMIDMISDSNFRNCRMAATILYLPRAAKLP